MSSKDDLAEAFSGESQANRKYLAFGERAEKDGFPVVARLFRGVAAAEAIHAASHLRAMDGVSETAANLAEAMAGEHHEFTEMYPPMVAAAKAEGDTRAERSMTHALEVEKVHHALFQRALEAVKGGLDLADAPVRICPVCGHTVVGDAPDQCPVCKAKGERYIAVA